MSASDENKSIKVLPGTATVYMEHENRNIALNCFMTMTHHENLYNNETSNAFREFATSEGCALDFVKSHRGNIYELWRTPEDGEFVTYNMQERGHAYAESKIQFIEEMKGYRGNWFCLKTDFLDRKNDMNNFYTYYEVEKEVRMKKYGAIETPKSLTNLNRRFQLFLNELNEAELRNTFFTDKKLPNVDFDGHVVCMTKEVFNSRIRMYDQSRPKKSFLLITAQLSTTNEEKLKVLVEHVCKSERRFIAPRNLPFKCPQEWETRVWNTKSVFNKDFGVSSIPKGLKIVFDSFGSRMCFPVVISTLEAPLNIPITDQKNEVMTELMLQRWNVLPCEEYDHEILIRQAELEKKWLQSEEIL